MKSLKIKKRSTKSEGVREDHTWIQVEKPNSNTQECYPIRWKGPLQQGGNTSYHSICPRKSSVERQKVDEHRYGSIQHGAAFTGHKHTFNVSFHLILELEAPFLCILFLILFFYLLFVLYLN